MVTEVNIVNLSLANLWQEGEVTSLDVSVDTSIEAKHASVFYPISRDKLLAMHAWDFATARADLALFADLLKAAYSQNFSVSTQETSPQDLAFKTDGTKMYVLGDTGDDVNEYDLSTAWDVSTAVYLQNFDVSTQEATPTGLAFSTDGTKMYILGTAGDDVNEYDLSTAWDISTAVYLQNFDISGQETEPTALAFKPDGTKMYVLGDTGDDVNEYDLSTAWDVTTAVYLQNFSVAVQEATPVGLAFSAGGTEMYVMGAAGDDVNEYDLSTAWDISTAVFSQTFSISEQEATPTGLAFSADGTKMYVLGDAGDDVNEYDLVPDVPDPTAGLWGYSYQLPADLIRPLVVLLPEAADDAAGQTFSIETRANGKVTLYTNVKDATLKYVRQVTNTLIFSPLFVTTLAALLSTYLSGPLTKNVKITRQMKEDFAAEFILATAIDAGSEHEDLKSFVPNHLSARDT